MTEREDHPWDICLCGDYREVHLNGVGACKLNSPRDQCHGYRDCTQFRLAERVNINRRKP